MSPGIREGQRKRANVKSRRTMKWTRKGEGRRTESSRYRKNGVRNEEEG